MPDSVIVAWSSCPDEQTAEALATALTESRTVACVSVLPGARSTYRWQDRIVTENEVLLMLKTTAAALPALEAELKRLHPYDVPELIVVEAVGGSAEYLSWVAAETR